MQVSEISREGIVDFTFIFVLFIGFFVFILFVWLALMELRHRRVARTLRTLLTGRAGADLEAVLQDYISRMDRIERTTNSLSQQTVSLAEKQPYVVQHVGMVRFNPFADKGGDQSFAIALLDDHTDGVVISCLHTRADNKVYAKPIVGGQSSYNLTDEEKQAIARAMKPRA